MKIIIKQAHSGETRYFFQLSYAFMFAMHLERPYSHFPFSILTTHSTLYIFKSRDIITWEEKEQVYIEEMCTCWTFRKRYTQIFLPIKLRRCTFVSVFSWSRQHRAHESKEKEGESDDNETLRCHELLSSILHHFGSFLLKKIIKFREKLTTHQFVIRRNLRIFAPTPFNKHLNFFVKF